MAPESVITAFRRGTTVASSERALGVLPSRSGTAARTSAEPATLVQSMRPGSRRTSVHCHSTIGSCSISACCRPGGCEWSSDPIVAVVRRESGPHDAARIDMNHANLAAQAALAAVLSLSTYARAGDSTSPGRSEPAPSVDTTLVPAPRSLPHRHDGFYLRLSTGFGPYNEAISRSGEQAHTTVSGVATTGDFAIGGSVRPGLVFGGAGWTSSVLVADARTDAGQIAPPSAGQRSSYSVVGPWMDCYFNPNGGLHMPASLGFAVVRGLD